MRIALVVAAIWMSAGMAAAADGNGFRMEVEGGAVWQSRNDAQSPSRPSGATPAGTRFSYRNLLGDGPEGFARFTGAYTWNDRHQVHVLVAPLRVSGRGSFATPVSFQGQTFAANVATQGSYRFDSYRIGYRYRLVDTGPWMVWVGGTLKIRDANITLRQGTRVANRANTGPVPLLSAYVHYDLAPRWRAILDVEGLAAPQGRAIDAALKLRYAVRDDVGVSAGYRTLEGGADNKTIYTFAWLHYALVSVDVRF